jgi:hypothetical protein
VEGTDAEAMMGIGGDGGLLAGERVAGASTPATSAVGVVPVQGPGGNALLGVAFGVGLSVPVWVGLIRAAFVLLG